MRRLVWRWGQGDGKWLTYGLEKMHFSDRPAVCGLKIGKHMVADLGKTIDPEASEMINKGYVDDIIAADLLPRKLQGQGDSERRRDTT